LLPPPPRTFRTTIISNADATSREVVERVTEPGTAIERTRPLGLEFPADVYSLSHVALPFPVTDALYGLDPDPAAQYGINQAYLPAAGGLRALLVNASAALRLLSNPFFPSRLERIDPAAREGSLPAATAPRR